MATVLHNSSAKPDRGHLTSSAAFHCLTGPLYLAIAFEEIWTARNVVELV